MILGIDPGASTGLAFFERGHLVALRTITPTQIERELRELARTNLPRVFFEDSRLESRLWTAQGTRGSLHVMLKTARDVGRIDAWCDLIQELCDELAIERFSISPSSKGAKIKADVFASITGHAGRCNQHERDAAMVVWPYRNSIAAKPNRIQIHQAGAPAPGAEPHGRRGAVV